MTLLDKRLRWELLLHEYVPDFQQIADILTKSPVSQNHKFRTHRSNLNVLFAPTIELEEKVMK